MTEAGHATGATAQIDPPPMGCAKVASGAHMALLREFHGSGLGRAKARVNKMPQVGAGHRPDLRP